MSINKLQLKRSAVVGKIPTTASLDLGEIAINTVDGKIYFKQQDTGSVQRILELTSTSGSHLSASYAQTSSYSDRFTVSGTLTAQTLIVQTVSSSIIYSSGSNTFGNSLANNQRFTGSVDITGSLTINGRNYLTDSASFDTRIGYVSSSFNSHTASFNAFSSSILSYTSSNNAAIADILLETASLNRATASLNAFSASILNFTASTLVNSASFDTRINYISSSFNASTASFNAYSASINAFSASMLLFTSSTLVNSASFDTRIKYLSSSFESATASLNAFSSSIFSTTASLNRFSSSILNFTASQKNSNGTFATTGSNQFNGNQTITGSLIQGLEGNIATGEYSHAEGSITKAIGDYSHAEGDNTQAVGNYSHAEGQDTIALGQYSHAEGFNTIASANYQHVQGQFNATSSVPAAFIVGNGTDDGNRSNLIYAAGNGVEITGSLKITGSAFITGSVNVYGGGFNVDGVNVLDTALAYAIALG